MSPQYPAENQRGCTHHCIERIPYQVFQIMLRRSDAELWHRWMKNDGDVKLLCLCPERLISRILVPITAPAKLISVTDFSMTPAASFAWGRGKVAISLNPPLPRRTALCEPSLMREQNATDTSQGISYSIKHCRIHTVSTGVKCLGFPTGRHTQSGSPLGSRM